MTKFTFGLGLLAVFIALAAGKVLPGHAHGHPNGVQTADSGKKFVCYYGTWSCYRPDSGKHCVENIDPFLCTHLVYGFTGLKNNVITPLDPYLDLEENWGKANFKNFNSLKEINPRLKTIIAIGGWNEGSERYSAMASSAATRKTFIDSVVSFIDEHGFDGLDMDWEYPTDRGGVPADRENFAALLKEIKEAFLPRGWMLTAAVSAGKDKFENAYDIPTMNQYMDHIHLMTYDMHGAWDTYAHHNAPLYEHPFDADHENATYFNIEFSVKMWIAGGVDRSKLMLGMPTYGRCFYLDDDSQTGVFANASQPCGAGPYSRERGTLFYNEICAMIKDGGFLEFERVWDDNMKVPYLLFKKSAWEKTTWLGYDDLESIAYKVDLVKEYDLGGGMVWSLDTDDFTNYCGMGANPIMTYISTNLGVDQSQPTTTPAPTTTPCVGCTTTTEATTASTTQGTTTTAPPMGDCDASQCTSAGDFPLSECSANYCVCIDDVDGAYRTEARQCGAGTAFQATGEGTGICNWLAAIPGCSN